MTNLEITLGMMLILFSAKMLVDHWRILDLEAENRGLIKRNCSDLALLDTSRADYNRVLKGKQNAVTDLQKIRNIVDGKGSF